ncbi:TetR family transcriptional regulator [Nocardia sp. NPDC052254]|uniref:TetR/AcrR family transcriptional regulator n=1 Tax=Nocardia sp. NPDC052254 TaxID=3155681 RepID=UPI003431DE7E
MVRSDGAQSRASTGRASRRDSICAAALELAAEGGNRAVTHHAIDDRLGIARGSTSYYYRTRRDLLTAAITHLTTTSRTAFRAALDTSPRRPDPVGAAADLIAGQLDLLIGERRRDALARCALAADTADDEELRRALAGCLFSVPAAENLLISLSAPDPVAAARDLVSLLEGLLFDRLLGTRALLDLRAGTSASIDDLRAPVHRWLTALLGDS